MGIDRTSSATREDDPPASATGDDSDRSAERTGSQQASPNDDRVHQRAETRTREQYADAVRADGGPMPRDNLEDNGEAWKRDPEASRKGRPTRPQTTTEPNHATGKPTPTTSAPTTAPVTIGTLRTHPPIVPPEPLSIRHRHPTATEPTRHPKTTRPPGSRPPRRRRSPTPTGPAPATDRMRTSWLVSPNIPQVTSPATGSSVPIRLRAQRRISRDPATSQRRSRSTAKK